MFGRGSNFDTSHIDVNQIVEPGRSDKAAFDPKAYHAAMRGGRSEGMIHYLVAFLGGAFAGLFISAGFAVGGRGLFALVGGLAFVFGLYSLRKRKLRRSNAKAVELHAQVHVLEMEAKRLEVEKAKAAGAFDRWKKS